MYTNVAQLKKTHEVKNPFWNYNVSSGCLITLKRFSIFEKLLLRKRGILTRLCVVQYYLYFALFEDDNQVSLLQVLQLVGHQHHSRITRQ